jgi:hypothetical protein
MAEQARSSRRRNALMAVLFSQMSRSPELTKLMVLLLVWGNVRSRPGYTTLDGGPNFKPSRLKRPPKGRGFGVRRARERFL